MRIVAIPIDARTQAEYVSCNDTHTGAAVSRGLGSVERAIIAIARHRSRTAGYIARHIYDTRPISATQISSVRRALRRLAARGLVKVESALPTDDGRVRWLVRDPGSVERERRDIGRAIRRVALENAATAAHEEELASGGDVCRHCRRQRMPEGYDACLGRLPGVVAACCGHGGSDGYVAFEGSGLVLRGRWDHVATAGASRREERRAQWFGAPAASHSCPAE
jgi:hypothetical protein